MGTTLTIVPNDVVRRFVFVPDGHAQRRPETVFEALYRGHDVLKDEERWTQGTEWRSMNGKDDPFCGNWRACAIGAVGLVTVGLVDRHAKHMAEGTDVYVNMDSDTYRPDWSYCINWDQESPDADLSNADAAAFLLYRKACAALDVAAGGSIVSVNDANRGRAWSAKAQSRQDVLAAFKLAMRYAQAIELHPNKHVYYNDADL